MLYKYKEKSYNIDEKEIDNLKNKLNLTEKKAVELYLIDNDILPPTQEQKELEKVKVNHGITYKKCENRKKRIVNNSQEKLHLVNSILDNLKNIYGDENINVLTENKLYEIKINEKTFKINISQNRK